MEKAALFFYLDVVGFNPTGEQEQTVFKKMSALPLLTCSPPITHVNIELVGHVPDLGVWTNGSG